VQSSFEVSASSFASLTKESPLGFSPSAMLPRCNSPERVCSSAPFISGLTLMDVSTFMTTAYSFASPPRRSVALPVAERKYWYLFASDAMLNLDASGEATSK